MCWAPLHTLKDAFENPHTVHRGMHLRDEAGNSHIGVPIRFASEPGRPTFSLPEYGEHSEDIAAQAGIDAERIADLKDRGVI